MKIVGILKVAIKKRTEKKGICVVMQVIGLKTGCWNNLEKFRVGRPDKSSC